MPDSHVTENHTPIAGVSFPKGASSGRPFCPRQRGGPSSRWPSEAEPAARSPGVRPPCGHCCCRTSGRSGHLQPGEQPRVPQQSAGLQSPFVHSVARTQATSLVGLGPGNTRQLLRGVTRNSGRPTPWFSKSAPEAQLEAPEAGPASHSSAPGWCSGPGRCWPGREQKAAGHRAEASRSTLTFPSYRALILSLAGGWVHSEDL